MVQNLHVVHKPAFYFFYIIVLDLMILNLTFLEQVEYSMLHKTTFHSHN